MALSLKSKDNGDVIVKILTVAVLAIVLTCAMTFAQTTQTELPPPAGDPTVKVGDGTVSGARLTPYDNAWVVTLSAKDGRTEQPGIWTDQLRLREIDGRKVFVRTQGQVYYRGHVQWSINTFDPITLAPISSEVHQPNGAVEKRKFNGAHVEVRTTGPEPGAKEELHEFDLPSPAYDFNCCMASLFAATLPLRVGYTAVLPAVVASKADDKGTPYRVVGHEQVQAGAKGMVDAFVVEYPNPGCCIIRFWVTDVPRRIVRMTLSSSPGQPYGQSFDMIK